MSGRVRTVLSVGVFVAAAVSALQLFSQTPGEPFCEGWLFTRGELSRKAAQPDFDDRDWQPVRIPHDWAIAGPFEKSAHGSTGKLPWKGVGWYRKDFFLGDGKEDQRVYLDFDGVMAVARVYVNGTLAGEWDYGYTSFRVDATPHVKFGEANTVAVQVDTREWGSRWYPGAGIYRKVALVVRNPVHLAHWGVTITTPRVTPGSAAVTITSAIENHLQEDAAVAVEVTLLDPHGAEVASGEAAAVISPRGSETANVRLEVTRPALWDLESPSLYQARVAVREGGEVVDESATEFGIRTFAFTADDGFHLNGRRVQLKGVNLHHDQGPLGAAFYPRAAERQLEIMRDIGVNTIRTSHNPPAPELLELCDRMGFLVWDECFDKWDHTAGRHDGKPPLPQFAKRQLRSMVLRDRNHPSVVVWSIGNEVNPGEMDGVTPERVAMLGEIVRRLDPTRPVGMGCHIPEVAEGPAFASLDLTGWNYAQRYATMRERFPDKPIVYSESASTVSTRGFYDPQLPRRKTDYSSTFQVSSYDLNAAPWSDIPDREFELMEADSFVAGEIVWTGFDYLGEPTPFDQTARSSYFGIVDLCGIPKDRYYLYRSHWRSDEPTLHILPHWSWPGREGTNIPVFVYTNGDEAELFLNGRSLGRRHKGAPPARPPNLALGRRVTASSNMDGHPANAAADGDGETWWRAAAPGRSWLQVDLGDMHDIRFLAVNLPREEKLYAYEISVSDDQELWQLIAEKAQSFVPQWGGPHRFFHDLAAAGRYLRIEFSGARDDAPIGLRELGVFTEPVESEYYDSTYRYRLRWNTVPYEPGELKVVAYRRGRSIGETVQRTAGSPHALRLSADRTRLEASGDDLCYVLVEVVDKNGTLCPDADNLVRFTIDGPAEIAAVGNGNPMSFEPFQAGQRRAFHGKAMVILRSQWAESGGVRLTAESEGLTGAHINMKSE